MQRTRVLARTALSAKPAFTKAAIRSNATAAGITRISKGPRYSQIVIHNGVVHIAGQVGTDNTKDVKDQTRQVLGKIDALLKQAGTNKSRLLTAQVWLEDVKDFDKLNEVWEAWIDKDNPPTRATGEVKLFGGWKVEVIVSAALPQPVSKL